MTPNQAALWFVFGVCFLSVYAGVAIDSATHIPETIRWDRECAKRNSTTCTDGIVCKWSTVKDRCEGKDGTAVSNSVALVFTFFGLLAVMGVIIYLTRSQPDKSRHTQMIHMSMCVCVVFAVCRLSLAIAFEDTPFTVIGLLIGSVALCVLVGCLRDVKIAMRYEIVVDEEEGGGEEEDDEEEEDASRSSSPGLFEETLEAARAVFKPKLPSYEAVVVGDSPIMDELLQ